MRKVLSLIVSMLVMCLLMSSCKSIDEAIELSNIVCIGQTFSSPELAIDGMEQEARENYSVELDYCPPYRLVYSFEYEGNTIVFYSYSHSYDGTASDAYAIRVLRQNDEGKYVFTGGFADFIMQEPTGENDLFYYYYTNIQTSVGVKSISFLYLEKDNCQDVYVDGVKCKKDLVAMDEKEFYLCYSLSQKDTFFTNLFTPIPLRHTVRVE